MIRLANEQRFFRAGHKAMGPRTAVRDRFAFNRLFLQRSGPVCGARAVALTGSGN